MAEAKDPAIKLFGKTIPLPDVLPAAAAADTSCSPADDVIDDELPSSRDILPAEEDMSEDRAPEGTESDKGDLDENTFHVKQVGTSHEAADKNACQDASPGTNNNPEASSGVDEKAGAELSKSEEENTDTSNSQDKTPKKPDKILPCPRCNSMETKFCYYNNYNVNQPRHFCKNCQRYWTAGGTMRNVPVGAGRRKNKSSASHYRHVAIPEALQNTRPETLNMVHPGVQRNGTVLTFGTDAPLCESMASILNLAEKTMRNCAPNGFQKPEEVKIPIPFVAMESGGKELNGLSSKDHASKSTLKEPAAQSCLPFPPQVPCYPGAPWPYPWNSAQWSLPVAGPPFCPNGIAVPFFPAPAYWGCTVPGSWSIPWIAQPSPSQSNPCSGPNSPTLGKHSRDGNMLTSTNLEEKETGDNNPERSLWIPKTLRIDDPGKAAKSSIWTTLGITSNEKSDSICRGSGLFKAFQSTCDERDPNLEKSTVLEANPAALSRSQNFQENS